MKRMVLDSSLLHLKGYAPKKGVPIKNRGIQAPSSKEPRKVATPSKPFFKVYSKEGDFNTKSKDFALKHFPPGIANGVIRYECTIKNRQHRAYLGIEAYSEIYDFLDKVDLQSVCVDLMSKYFKRNPRMTMNTEELKFSDKMLVGFIELSIELGATDIQIKNKFDELLEEAHPNTRTKWRKKYHELTSTISEKSKEIMVANTRNSTDFYKNLGIDVS